MKTKFLIDTQPFAFRFIMSYFYPLFVKHRADYVQPDIRSLLKLLAKKDL